MKYKTLYRIVFTIITFILIADFLYADIVVINRNAPLLMIFIPAEALVSLVWVMIIRHNRKSVIAIRIKNGTAAVETLGKLYRVPVSEIRIKKAFIHYKLCFNGVELHADNSIKSVGDFIDKCRNVPHRNKK